MTDMDGKASNSRLPWNAWKVAYVVILVLALVTRLVVLGDRAVSHDETTHAKYSWNLYAGQGFRHDPLMHGPLLFEATAFLYALFGVSDFTARLYTALTGVALVMAPLLFRRWLGRLGALLASVMVLISPSLTYYSRYTRHDIPILLASTLLLWAVLRYVEEGESRWLRWVGVFFALMYASKENAYIYTAIFMGLLALPLFWQVLRARWRNPEILPMVAGLLILVLVAGGVFAFALSQAEVVPEGEGASAVGHTIIPAWGRIGLGVAVIGLLLLLVLATRMVGAAQMRSFRFFDVLMVLGTFTLPLGSALLMQFVAGVDMSIFYPALMNPLDPVSGLNSLPLSFLIAAPLILILSLAGAVVLGLWWDAKRWPTIALVHYGVFIALFSTLFTYGMGILTGLVGGLAYWIAQQAVERGTQPWYYYGIVGPLYEYAPILLSLIGAGWLVVREVLRAGAGRTNAVDADQEEDRAQRVLDLHNAMPRLFPFFLLVWAGLSWVAYTVAGEKMPWLFVHIAFPHLLLAAWTLDQGFGHLSWRSLVEKRAWLVPVSLILLILAWLAFQASSGTIRSVLQQSGAGEQLALTIEQLQPLGRTLGGLAGVLLFGGLLLAVGREIGTRRFVVLGAVTLVLLLGGLTLRTMVMLNYINDELATEYMVYAHGTPDVRQALSQIKQVSWRLTGTPDQLQVAYGRDVAWPFYWYMYSQYPNHYYFETPEPEKLLASPVILAAKSEWAVVEEIIGARYDVFDYKHVWWPLEDYKDLTWERIRTALTDPRWRSAVWDIVWNRDYTAYARLRNTDDPFTLKTWPHRGEFRLYIRRDLAAQVWDSRLQDGQIVAAGSSGLGEAQFEADPFGDRVASTTSLRSVSLTGTSLQGMDVAPDGSIYVADSANHQIWHLSADGDVIARWGSYGSGHGQFNGPWDVAVDAEGDLYVADTWNHRIQKFDPDGQFVTGWGRLAQVDLNDWTGYGAFYGPRGVAVGPDGNVYVADTGNNRIQVFNGEGQFLHTFGGVEAGPGGLLEPVSLGVNALGEVFVADVWNRRIRVFDAEGIYLREWAVPVWVGTSVREGPQLAVGDTSVLVTDPAYGRVLAFDPEGHLQEALQDTTQQLLPGGVAVTDVYMALVDRQASQVLFYPFED